MNFGINEKDERIEPFSKGHALCELCKAPLYAYGCNGYIRDPAWHHKAKIDCDTWWENETEWHKDWKAKFPKGWRERALFDDVNVERHRADVLCPSGLVLEFQRSSISPQEIQAREEFYGTMLWIVFGEDFNDRFELSSTRSDEQSFLYTEHNSSDIYARGNHNQLEQKLKDELRLLQDKKDKLDYQSKWDLQKIEDLRKPTVDGDGVLDKLMDPDLLLTSLRYTVPAADEADEQEFLTLKTELHRLQTARKTKKKLTEDQEDLMERKRFRNTDLIQFTYDSRHQQHYASLFWLSNTEVARAWGMNPHRFERRTDYLAHNWKTKDHIYFFDPKPSLETRRTGIQASESEIESATASLAQQALVLSARKNDRRIKDLNDLISSNYSV